MEYKDEFILNVNSSIKTEYKDLSCIPSEGIQLQYLAPTVYQARDWIMKKYNIVLLADWNETFSSRYGYSSLHFGFKIYKKFEVRGYYRTIEQALDAGILYVLNNENLWQNRNTNSEKLFSMDGLN